MVDRYSEWLGDPNIDDETKAELLSIANNPKEIEDRFYKDLEFGTGGLRGILGAGTNRLNVYTIRKATQGLASYIAGSSAYKPGMGVVIAHDCRRMSPEFCVEAALVLNANGIKTYVFDSLRPTPLLSFAVRELGCIAGIVITASHNPPEYNGYKVYWSDGGQCTYPRDEAIIGQVQDVRNFDMVKNMPLKQAKAAGLFNIAPPSIDDMYIKQVKAQMINQSITNSTDLRIVYTPLHGAGSVSVQRALKEAGFANVYVVKEQEEPDGNFPTVKSPNPEEMEAFTMAIKLAGECAADIVIATDPDCDRVGVAVKDAGGYKLLSGNMIGVILTEYILTQRMGKLRLEEDGVVVSTVVSTNMTRLIAQAHGIEYVEVLTGFKYIGEKIKQFEEAGNRSFIFGFEESYGYLTGTYTRDKDAVAATLLICEAAAFYAAQGRNLYQQLQKLYKMYGLHREHVESITLKGVDGIANISKIMNNLRDNPPFLLGDAPITEVRDYKSRIVVSIASGQTGSTNLPVSDVVYFATGRSSWACIRPSGTEPKIKIYYGVYMPADATEEEADKKLIAMATSLRATIEEML